MCKPRALLTKLDGHLDTSGGLDAERRSADIRDFSVQAVALTVLLVIRAESVLEGALADVTILRDASNHTVSLARLPMAHANVLPAVPLPLGKLCVEASHHELALDDGPVLLQLVVCERVHFAPHLYHPRVGTDGL